MELVAEMPELDRDQCGLTERGGIEWQRTLPIIASLLLAIAFRLSLCYLEAIKKRVQKRRNRQPLLFALVCELLSVFHPKTKKPLPKRPYVFVLRKQDKENDSHLRNFVFQFIREMDAIKQTRDIEMLTKPTSSLLQQLEDYDKDDDGNYLYKSQLCYENGSHMCTPTCILFATAMVGFEVCSCPPTKQHMHQIMQSGSKVQRLLLSQYPQNHMFSIRDVLDHMTIPSVYQCIEIVGSIARLPDGFITTFEDDENNKQWITDLYHAVTQLKDNSALVITLRRNAHTVTLYRLDSENYWFFDPLLAVVKNMGDCNTALFELFKIARLAEEFTGLMIAKA